MSNSYRALTPTPVSRTSPRNSSAAWARHWPGPTPGFVANRLQFALYKEAVQLVDEAVATPAEIDALVSNTFAFRLARFGPFAIGDMAGLDV